MCFHLKCVKIYSVQAYQQVQIMRKLDISDCTVRYYTVMKDCHTMLLYTDGRPVV